MQLHFSNEIKFVSTEKKIFFFFFFCVPFPLMHLTFIYIYIYIGEQEAMHAKKCIIICVVFIVVSRICILFLLLLLLICDFKHKFSFWVQKVQRQIYSKCDYLLFALFCFKQNHEYFRLLIRNQANIDRETHRCNRREKSSSTRFLFSFITHNRQLVVI